MAGWNSQWGNDGVENFEKRKISAETKNEKLNIALIFFSQANPQSTHSLGRPTPASAPTLAKVTGRPHHTRTWNTRGDERDLITRTDSRLSHEKKFKLIRSFKEPAPPNHSTRPGPVRTKVEAFRRTGAAEPAN